MIPRPPKNPQSWWDLQRHLRAAGFAYGDGLDIAYAVICAESDKDAGRTGPERDAFTVGNDDGTVDRGLVQLNSKAQARFTDAQAYDPAEACVAMRTIYLERGKKFTAWSAFLNDSFRAFMDEARAARDAYEYALALGFG